MEERLMKGTKVKSTSMRCASSANKLFTWLSMTKMIKGPPRYVDGIWLGVNELNSEIFVGTPEGVRRSRSVMRRPDKWSRPAVEAIVGVPWCFTGDGEDPIPKVVFQDRKV